MQKHHEPRARAYRPGAFEDDTDWGQPRSRVGHGKRRRFRHEPYRREPACDRHSWFALDDDSD